MPLSRAADQPGRADGKKRHQGYRQEGILEGQGGGLGQQDFGKIVERARLLGDFRQAGAGQQVADIGQQLQGCFVGPGLGVGEGLAMILAALQEERGQQGDAQAAAEISEEGPDGGGARQLLR